MPIKEAPQASTQHAVPQNIMDVEFKLIGDLTMRQFFYLMIFVGIAYAAWSFNIPSVLKWPTVIISVLLGLGFAFIPVEDRGLDEWVVNFLVSIYGENQRIWKKTPTPPSAFLLENISIMKQELITLAPTTSRRKLEHYLLAQHETKEKDPLDIPEQAYIEKVRAAFMEAAPVQTAVALEEPLTEAPPEEFPMLVAPEEEETPKKKAPEEKKDDLKTAPKITKTRPKVKKQRAFIVPTTGVSIPLAPITPDRHTGRKFTNLLASEGSIVLPIRGEKTLQVAEEPRIDENTQEKAEQLQQYLKQITEGGGTKLTEEKEEERKAASAAEEVIKNIQSENKKLMTEIEKLKADLEKSEEKDAGKKRGTLQKLLEQQTKKEETLKELQTKVRELKPQEPGKPAEEMKAAELEPPKIPNIVTGVVKDIQDHWIANVLLIIKNAHGDPIRAIKTNALGRFTISNPLPNGTYKIKADVNEETGFTFDIIDVEANGSIIPPLEFVAK
jgi:hypothetical protein